MIPIADIDAPTIGAFGVMAVGIVTAIVAPLVNRGKSRAETESIATKTTLEVNEDLRQELKYLREEHGRELKVRDKRIETLEAQVEKRDDQIAALERRVQALRDDIDTLEAEIVGLRNG